MERTADIPCPFGGQAPAARLVGDLESDRLVFAKVNVASRLRARDLGEHADEALVDNPAGDTATGAASTHRTDSSLQHAPVKNRPFRGTFP
jgi:hypothetical protein